jgi:hypothetical protein
LHSLELDLETGALTITPAHIFVASPPGYSLDQLQTIDLPLYREVKVTKQLRDSHLVVSMPYVGEVKKLGPQQLQVMEFAQSPKGFVVRGNVSQNEALSIDHQVLSVNQHCLNPFVYETAASTRILRTSWRSLYAMHTVALQYLQCQVSTCTLPGAFRLVSNQVCYS